MRHAFRPNLATHKTIPLKGQCYEIFDFRFFAWNGFPQTPEYPIRAVSNFFETLQRYSQLKVHRRSWHRWQNFPPVSLTPVVNLDLRISPRIFKKVRTDPNVISRGLGEDNSWKKPEERNLVTLSLQEKNAQSVLDCLKYCSIKVNNWLCHPRGKYLIEKLSVLPPAGHHYI